MKKSINLPMLMATHDQLMAMRSMRGHLYQGIRSSDLTIEDALRIQYLSDQEDLAHWRSVMYRIQDQVSARSQIPDQDRPKR